MTEKELKLNNKIYELKNKLQESERRNITLENNIIAKDAKIEELTSELEQEKKETKRCKERIEYLENNISKIVENRINIFLSEFKKEKEELTKKVELLEKEVTECKEKIKEKDEEIKKLKTENDELRKVISEKDARISKLENSLKKNSFNSSKPPSSDNTYKKKTHICNSRKKGGKTGGQVGHKGSRKIEEIIEDLEEIKNISVNTIKHGDIKAGEKEYVLYEIDVDFNCVLNKHIYNKEEYEKLSNIEKNHMYYGANMRSMIAYLSNELMIPIRKITDFFNEIFENKLSLSEGTIVNINKDFAARCEDIVLSIDALLKEEKTAHADETGIHVNGKLNWLHVLCSKKYSHYYVHEHRGDEAIKEVGLIGELKNVLVHDHFSPYYDYTNVKHAECNAHILRYLKGLLIEEEIEEISEFLDYLVELNKKKKEAINKGMKELPKEEIEKIFNKYDELTEKWLNSLNKRLKGKAPEKFVEEQRLQRRIAKYKENHLMFITDFDVPFDNNLAERALRMIKTKVKVSGGFRTEDGADNFAKIRSLIQTVKLQKLSILKNLKLLFEGKKLEIA